MHSNKQSSTRCGGHSHRDMWSWSLMGRQILFYPFRLSHYPFLREHEMVLGLGKLPMYVWATSYQPASCVLCTALGIIWLPEAWHAFQFTLQTFRQKRNWPYNIFQESSIIFFPWYIPTHIKQALFCLNTQGMTLSYAAAFQNQYGRQENFVTKQNLNLLSIFCNALDNPKKLPDSHGAVTVNRFLMKIAGENWQAN